MNDVTTKTADPTRIPLPWPGPNGEVDTEQPWTPYWETTVNDPQPRTVHKPSTYDPADPWGDIC